MAESRPKHRESAISGDQAAGLPVSALLSQALVAFTIEFDNDFELRMHNAGFPGSRLSLVVWANLMRFLCDGERSVSDLARDALTSPERLKHQLGCLERWGFIVTHPNPDAVRPTPKRAKRHVGTRRDGFGSGRGIRGDWIVRLAPAGQKAAEIWKPLSREIEGRWEARFGKRQIDGLRSPLRAVVDKVEFELPHGLPPTLLGVETFPPRVARDTAQLSLPALLSRALLAFAIEFERESIAPLELSANVLRVLGKTPIRLAELPRLTGGSPEQTDIGWQLKPYVVIEPDPTGSRGKVVRLSPRGLAARQIYRELTVAIENRWEKRVGTKEIGSLRRSLADLLDRRRGNRSLLSQGLVPPAGVARAGASVPSLGRRKVGVAARKRLRELAIQTEDFVRDPVGTLPHYPMWDMNRGFGP